MYHASYQCPTKHRKKISKVFDTRTLIVVLIFCSQFQLVSNLETSTKHSLILVNSICLILMYISKTKMTYFPNTFSTKILYQTFIVLSVITSSCNAALRSHIIDRKEQLQNPVLDIFCNNKRVLFYFYLMTYAFLFHSLTFIVA